MELPLPPPAATPVPNVELVAIDMGYGHLRAAQPLADELGVPMREMDTPPLGDEHDRKAWARARTVHERLSRVSQWPLIGPPFLKLMDAYTHIAPIDAEGQSKPSLGAREITRLIDRGLGARLNRELSRSGKELMTTFYAPALIADRARVGKISCLITDADCNRVWVPMDGARTTIRYFAPSDRVVQRLRAYGVPAARIVRTGFPLPLELLGGPGLPVRAAHFEARLARLRSPGEGPVAPLTVFAIGGAGAQLPLAHRLLQSLRPALDAGKLRLALVPGRRAAAAAQLNDWARALGIERGLEVLHAPDWLTYYRRFNELLARADVLWTKPSEMTFYGALGLPLLLAPPVGAHERYNAHWALSNGAALEQQDPARAIDWLPSWLADGRLARAAEGGFRSLPAAGTHEIAQALRAG